MSTVKAAFGRGIPLVDLDEVSAIPCCLVFQLGHKLTPTHVTDSLGQTVVFDHVLDCQRLDTDRLVFTDQTCRELCRKSRRLSAIRACILSYLLYGLWLYSCCPFVSWRAVSALSPASSHLYGRMGLPTVSPVERVTNAFKPRSAPTDCSTGSSCLISSSTRMDTK